MADFLAELRHARQRLTASDAAAFPSHGKAKRKSKKFDVFISHASEDKEAIARPLAQRLAALGLRVWFDEFSLRIGDSLRESIERGLAGARTGVVIFSPAFLRKEWTQKELSALVALETRRRRIVLPIWHEITAHEMQKRVPILADRVAINTSAGLDAVVKAVVEAVV